MISVSDTHEATPPPGDWQVIESEHASLRTLGERLEDALGRLADGPPDPAEASSTRALLETFHAQLFAHLAHEESQGVLEKAAAVEPRFEVRVRRLRAEHAELRGRMDELAASTADLGGSELYTRFVAFRRALRAHDRAETDILQRAYQEDVGGRG